MIDDILNEMNEGKKSISVKDRGGWNGLHNDMVNSHANRINSILHNTDDDDEFITIYFKILEYFVPKITREPKKAGNKSKKGETSLVVHKKVKEIKQE